MAFNEKLKEKRVELGLTQDDLASKLNISRQSVSKWEQGINEPDIDTLKQLSAILNISLDELLCNKESSNEENKISKSSKKEKIIKIFKYVSLGVAIFGTTLLLSLIYFMPETVGIHFDIHLNPDKFGSKYTYLYFIVLNWIFIIPNFAVRNEKYKDLIRQKFTYHLTMMIAQILITAMLIFLSSLAVKINIEDVSKFPILVVCSILISVGPFTHPKFNKRNSVFGFRTFLSITNDEVWNKMNAFCSIALTSAAVLAYILCYIVPDKYSIYPIFLVIGALIPAFIYHEILRVKINKNNDGE